MGEQFDSRAPGTVRLMMWARCILRHGSRVCEIEPRIVDRRLLRASSRLPLRVSPGATPSLSCTGASEKR